MDVRIQLCGRVVVQIDGRRVEGALSGRQDLMLLTYLAAHRDRDVTRDELMDALWPEGRPPSAPAALSRRLSKLRRVLGRDAIAGRELVRLDLLDVVIDLEVAEAALHRAESAIALADWTGAWGPARVALHTANRGILPGFDAPFLDDLRSRLEDIGARALICIRVSSLHLGGPELPAADRSSRALSKRSALPPAGTVTIMFADIAGSTRLTERLGDTDFRAVAQRLDGAVRAIIAETGGVPVEGKLVGDGLMAVFTSAREAIECAARTDAAAGATGLDLHLGLHAGDVLREGTNVFGGAVNIAARIAALAAPGEILVSETVRSLARTSASVDFEDRGIRSLDGVADPHRLYAVTASET